jgi:hypothetical protein
MIGYSDSNKDAGYLAANWEQFQAQEKLVTVCEKHNITLTLYHGRGGTEASGGGPNTRKNRAHPAGTENGRSPRPFQDPIKSGQLLWGRHYRAIHHQHDQGRR